MKTFTADIKRYRNLNKNLLHLFFEQGLWAIGIYRFGCWVRGFHIPVLSFFLRFLAFLLYKLTEITTGISLPSSAKIGKGFYIGHFGNIILHTKVTMGENCSIGPGVIIGTRGLGDQGVPILGNNVYVGAGAKLLGRIKIGNNAKIGANAVVLTDVPDSATAVGNPAKIVNTFTFTFLSSLESLEPLALQALMAV